MQVTNRQYLSSGYVGKVYVSQQDPANDPDIVVKDGDIWHVPGSTIPYIRYGNAWYAAEIYGEPAARPQTGIPGQKFIELLPNNTLGQMYIAHPVSGAFVKFMPQHELDPAQGVHTGKLPISRVTGHTRNNPVHVELRMEAILMSQAIGAPRASSTMI